MLHTIRFEFFPVIIWYLFFAALGWITFPLAYTCFRFFPDRGFFLAKIQGVFLVSYLIWFSTSCGFIHYYRHSITLILLLYVIINFILLFYQFERILKFVKTHIKLFLLSEGIFLVFFLGCVIIRMYNPDLTGAEKEADFTILNAILHSKTFPPKDTWFVGSPINYYYFGYLIWTTVIKFTGIISPIGFNLGLATTVALAATGAFGLVYHLTQRISYSIFSSLLLSALGNLDGLVQVFEKFPLSPFYKGGEVFPFDWWRSSRVIPDTINEFPYFSFLLGDLHAHFMSIPFGLLLLGLLSQFVAYF
jgi:YYY domain-containing protein